MLPVEHTFAIINKDKYPTLMKLDNAIQLAEDDDKAKISKLLEENGVYINHANAQFLISLALADDDMHNELALGSKAREVFEEYLNKEK